MPPSPPPVRLAGFQLLELQLHLLEEAGLALRAAAMDVALQLLDLQRSRAITASEFTAWAPVRRPSPWGYSKNNA
ncbi:hypothetical protein NXT3_PB00262 (plasmid) [Sinorhizobium fredii]|uniref:Uncharacterized protein n=1 Tax=Rhizobium fredii TaxID=380 RepID=A0A2L0HBP8_RHIFR|nr:hypothetical protein NXT3_PB00262 [Sinorhizobium fredii]